MSEALGWLVAFQHADAAFPSGGFAFSNGLEASAALVEELGAFELEAFVAAQILHRWNGADRVALVRAHRLHGNLEALAALDAEVEASLLSEAFRLASRRNGLAFLTAHERIGTAHAREYRGLVRAARAFGHLPVVQALAWSALGVPEETAVLMSGYTSLTNLSSAAVRLGLIGAIDAQAVITRTLPLIARCARSAVDDDAPLASFLPLAEIAVARHGASGVRLFSS
jgi:urease accessory protein